MTKTFTINKGQKPTSEQLKEVEEAKKYPIEFDEDAFFESLKELKVLAYEDGADIRNAVKKIVPSYRGGKSV